MERTWITDANGNRCSVEYWGSEAEARKRLATLENCFRCSGCSGCSRCSDMAPQKNDFAVPVIEDIHKKIYEAASNPGALNMNTWHSCNTTHCRAGWAVHLAGEAGYELEKRTSVLFAAQQIYKASGYEISPVRFLDENAAAMADMKRLAWAGD